MQLENPAYAYDLHFADIPSHSHTVHDPTPPTLAAFYVGQGLLDTVSSYMVKDALKR